MQRICDHDGCWNGLATGHALYRVSPKPGPFVGLCEEHYAGAPDPVTRAIEDANHGARPLPRTEAPK